jgi:hypothetical protein
MLDRFPFTLNPPSKHSESFFCKLLVLSFSAP